MVILQIDDVKVFMKYLLIDKKFDEFELIQGSITTYNTFEIDGRIKPEFFGNEYDSSDLYDYNFTPWSKSKELAFSLIKGKYTPLAFKFVMRAGNQLMSSIPDIADRQSQISSLIINIKYDSQGLTIVTGSAQNSFSMDRSVDEAWDKWVSSFIQGMQ